jgi:nucleoid DNA-binding protein
MADNKATKSKKALTKSAVFQELAAETGLSKKQVMQVFEALSELIKREVTKKGGAGQFTLPGLVKIQLKRKKATGPRKGRNPSTGEEITIPAKPARNIVRARVLKPLQELVK